MGLGIYIGDSHACVVKNNDDLICNTFGNMFTPCLVTYTDTGVLVGEEAHMIGDSRNTIFGFRRMLGKTYDEVLALPMFKNCPFSIVQNTNDNKFNIAVEVAGVAKLVTPEEVLQHLFVKLCQNAKDFTGEEHRDVIVAVHSSATDAERTAMRDAASMAGLNVVRVASDVGLALRVFPSLQHTHRIVRTLVVKLGSHLTDLALVETEDGINDTLGLISLPFAGDSLDAILVDYFLQHKLRDVSLTAQQHGRLIRTCRRLKCLLSQNNNPNIEFEIGETEYNLEISRVRFEQLIKGSTDELINQIKVFCQGNKDFQNLVLIGGSANIPIVKASIEAALNMTAMLLKFDPAEAVCRGLGELVMLLCNQRGTRVEYFLVPNRNVKGCGLYDCNSENGAPVPMTHSKVHAEVLDVVAKVSVSQSFFYQGESPLEVVYLWPVDSRAAVCNFKAKVGDKEYEGELREKKAAFNKYDEAISESHGAFLMEKVSGDILQINLGNLAPHTEVTIHIEYLTTLTSSDKSKLTFTLPTIVANPYNAHAPDYDTTLPNTSYVPTILEVTCRSSTPIQYVSSPTHAITQASGDDGLINVKLSEGQSLSKNFMLHIHSETPLENVAWISSSPDFGPPAALLSVPPHPPPLTDKQVSNEFVFLIDRSGSMSGRIQQAKTALLLFVKSLPQGSYFNIIGFGSLYQKLFPQSQPYNEENVAVALKHLENLDSDLGGTEIMQPIEEILKAQTVGGAKKVILVTDGEVSNTDDIVAYVKSHKNGAQVFTLGIGDGCSRYLILEVAKSGDGVHDFVLEREPIGPKVIGLLKASTRPSVQDVKVEYITADGRSGSAAVKSTFYIEDKLMCYVLLDPSVFPPTQFKTSTVLRGLPEFVNSTTINLQPANFRPDNLIQLMTAYAQIQELELATNLKLESAGNPEFASMLSLSLAFNLLSKAASYVIIEKRTEANQETMVKEATVRKSGDNLYIARDVPFQRTHDLLLLDVTPLDLDITDGTAAFVTVIPRNSTIPTKKQVQYIYHQVLAGVPPELQVYEQRSNLLGSVPVPVASSSSPATTISLVVTFDIDANGVLNVSVKDLDSGGIESKTFPNDKGRLSKEQINDLIKESESFSTAPISAVDTHSSAPMMDLVRLQKLDGLWTLDEQFVSLFENSENIRNHPNLVTVRSFVSESEMAETLWATSLALAFFHSDDMLTRKDEWELLVDKSLESIKKVLLDEKRVQELLLLGRQGLQENSFLPPKPAINNIQLNNNNNLNHNYTSNSNGPSIEEVD